MVPMAERDQLAAAWDAGWCAGASRLTQQAEPPKANPYREPEAIEAGPR